jgi:hypothetical protein
MCEEQWFPSSRLFRRVSGRLGRFRVLAARSGPFERPPGQSMANNRLSFAYFMYCNLIEILQIESQPNAETHPALALRRRI